MKPNNDPLRLNVAALAAAGGQLEGTLPVSELGRLLESAATEAVTGPREVSWSARGEQRTRHGAAPEIWLYLNANVTVGLTCQRCLGTMDQAVAVDRWLRFVATEAEAQVLDAESEDDVLELPRALNLVELIEDELLLALPLVPMHEVCPAPLPVQSLAEEAPGESAPHPFAALKALKPPGSAH